MDAVVCICTLLAAIAGTEDILWAIALRNLEQREREKKDYYRRC